MMEKPGTFRALIDSLGGVASVASEISVGEFAVKKMKDRNSVAVRHWAALLSLAHRRGIDLTNDDLVRMVGTKVAA